MSVNLNKILQEEQKIKMEKEKEIGRKLEELKEQLQKNYDKTVNFENKKEEERVKAYENEQDEERKKKLEEKNKKERVRSAKKISDQKEFNENIVKEYEKKLRDGH